MWIYILVGLICNLIGALIMWFMMKPHEEGAIVIENGNAYLQLTLCGICGGELSCPRHPLQS